MRLGRFFLLHMNGVRSDGNRRSSVSARTSRDAGKGRHVRSVNSLAASQRARGIAGIIFIERSGAGSGGPAARGALRPGRFRVNWIRLASRQPVPARAGADPTPVETAPAPARALAARNVVCWRMQPHSMEPRRPDPGNDNDPGGKGRQMTFWLLMAIVGLLAAITVNLLGRL